MNADWQEQQLGSIVTFKTGKLDSNAAEESGAFPFFTCSPTTLSINSFGFDTEAVILAGNNANGIFSTKYYSGKFNAYQRTYVIEPINYEMINCRFLYYLISYKVGLLKELAIGSATKFLTKGILNSIPVQIPSKKEQDKVATLLAGLDDRITLLRETNSTLEAIGETLFKSWFMDFDPVREKIEGKKSVGLSAEIASIFPDKFYKDELGDIPQGWQVKKLSDICSIQKGCSYKGAGLSDNNGAYMFNLGCFNAPRTYAFENIKRYTGEYKDRHTVEAGDLILANTDMTQDRDILGRPLIIPEGFTKAFISHHVFKLDLSNQDKSLFRNFLFFSFKQSKFRERAVGYATGTTVLALPKEVLEGFKLNIPPVIVLNKFNESADVIFNSIQANLQKIKTLSKLRDTLLPRLISGQLRLPDAEEQIEAATV